MMPQSFLFNSFMTTLAITFSNNWQAACANMMVDWLLFFLRFVKLRVLYMPEEEREKSKLARCVGAWKVACGTQHRD